MTNLNVQSKHDQQLQLEEEMIGAGIARYRNDLAKAATKDLQASTKAGLKILKNTLQPLTKAIETFIQPSKGVRVPKTHYYLGLLDAESIAFITLKSVLNSITKRVTLTKAALDIGELIEDETRLRYFEKRDPKLYQQIHNKVKNKSSYDHKRTVFVHYMNKNEIEWTPWPKSDKLRLGEDCIHILIQSTRLAEILMKGDGRYYITATEETLHWFEKENKLCEVLSPSFYPMVIEPRDWTSPTEGGYLTNINRQVRLVKTYNKPYLEELKNVPMPLVYQAINHLQKTPWKINQQVLTVADALWDVDSEIANLPPRDDSQPRPCPFPSDLNPKDMTPSQFEIFIDWKREAARIYENNITNRSKRLLVSKVLYLAHKFKDEARIYFPHMLDFRGRVYAIPHFLNPQSTDLSKALLTFANGKPITNETAGNWLAIHGANVYGYDKVSLEERVQFIHRMQDTILAIADDPFGYRKWTEADKPWQFLAFCFEWAGYLKEGYGYVSHLPIALDGSCNGLQHFSAMLRDHIGGEAVNLIPSDKPQDIYQRVADVVIEKLKNDDSKLARQWLEFGIDRKITKRPVMILPYGGTRQACREYIEEHIWESLHAGQSNLFAEGDKSNIFEASLYLAGLVWDSIGEVVVAARGVMGWLRKAASLAAKEGLPVNWTSPSGFPVQQAYHEVRFRQLKTQLNGNILKPIQHTLQEYTDAIDKRRQSDGISPNFVHSMDAAALHLYVNRAVDRYDLESFCLVHDSYGTLAADTELSAQCIREVFVEMYQDDVLEDFRTQLLDLISSRNANKLPLVPPKGKLDLEVVKQSAFFFA